MESCAKNRPREQGFRVLQTGGGGGCGLCPLFQRMGNYAKNRLREQGFHVLQTGAEVGAGSARFHSLS